MGELGIGALLMSAMGDVTHMLGAERATIFLNDEKTNELWAMAGNGPSDIQIRVPNNIGIAGEVFTSGKSLVIPHAYADQRFNPSFDKKAGSFTRNILCAAIVSKEGKT